MEFRNRLYELRRKAGLSQEELADLLGVTRQAVQKWESGASRPDIDNLAALSVHFQVSLDYLVLGREASAQPVQTSTVINNYYTHGHYEYKSKRTFFGLPLVHINIGGGFRRAKGIIAIGNFATGLVAIGGLAVGLFSLGGASLGLLLALGGFALGAVAAGGIAAGLMAWGGLAFGLLAVGGVCCGAYAVGGMARGYKIAIGDVASGFLAIGPDAKGILTYTPPLWGSELASAKNAISNVCGAGTPAWLIRFLHFFAEHFH